MNVAELIEFLKTQPSELIVIFRCCSESCVLEASDIFIGEECEPRADGWVQNKRPDMPTQKYLILPGN